MREVPGIQGYSWSKRSKLGVSWGLPEALGRSQGLEMLRGKGSKLEVRGASWEQGEQAGNEVLELGAS